MGRKGGEAGEGWSAAKKREGKEVGFERGIE